MQVVLTSLEVLLGLLGERLRVGDALLGSGQFEHRSLVLGVDVHHLGIEALEPVGHRTGLGPLVGDLVSSGGAGDDHGTEETACDSDCPDPPRNDPGSSRSQTHVIILEDEADRGPARQTSPSHAEWGHRCRGAP